MVKSNLKSIEICAGAGGLSLGIKRAGFKHELLIDYNFQAIETLKANFNSKIWFSDISKISNEMLNEFKEIDLLAAGLPCQPFSYAGKKLGFEDTRGTLLYDYMRFVSKIKPRVLLIENVKGLLKHDKGRTFMIIKNEIEKNGYHFIYKILNANEYGVPQKRIRIFILGFKNKKDLKKFTWPKKHEYKPVLKDAIYNLRKSKMSGSLYNKRKKKIFKMIPPGGNWRSLPDNVAKDYMKNSYYLGGGKTGIARRMSYDEPSLTLTTSPQQNQTERCHPEFTRPFTIEEYARIQTFPDNYIFKGSISAKYRQIGNAVPVKLGEVVCNEIAKCIQK